MCGLVMSSSGGQMNKRWKDKTGRKDHTIRRTKILRKLHMEYSIALLFVCSNRFFLFARHGWGWLAWLACFACLACSACSPRLPSPLGPGPDPRPPSPPCLCVPPPRQIHSHSSSSSSSSSCSGSGTQARSADQLSSSVRSNTCFSPSSSSSPMPCHIARLSS